MLWKVWREERKWKKTAIPIEIRRCERRASRSFFLIIIPSTRSDPSGSDGMKSGAEANRNAQRDRSDGVYAKGIPPSSSPRVCTRLETRETRSCEEGARKFARHACLSNDLGYVCEAWHAYRTRWRGIELVELLTVGRGRVHHPLVGF